MKTILRLLLSALAVIILAELLPGAEIRDYLTAVWVALALAVLNFLVKPILIILTLPVTIVTLGLFLLIVNALMIQFAAYLVEGFHVDGIWWAVLFSLLLSLLQSLLHRFIPDDGARGADGAEGGPAA